MSEMNYAAVVEFSAAVVDDAVEGFAAPRNTLQPCMVALYAGDAPVSFARAASLSAEAQEDGIRLGWCGFRLPGLPQAFALGGEIQVRCGVTGKVLLKPKVEAESIERKTRTTQSLTLTEFLTDIRNEEGCTDVADLALFAYDHLRRHGGQSFLFASYQTFFQRDPDQAAIESWSGNGLSLAGVESYLLDIVKSDEFKNRAIQTMPGPFQAGFKFDRSLFL